MLPCPAVPPPDPRNTRPLGFLWQNPPFLIASGHEPLAEIEGCGGREGSNAFFTLVGRHVDVGFHQCRHVDRLARIDLGATLNFATVTGLEPGPSERDRELRDSIAELEESNLSRLLRAIRDWSFEPAGCEEPQSVPTGEINLPESALLVPPPDPEARFFTLLHEGRHRLLARRRTDDPRAWFDRFRRIATAAFAEDRSIASAELLELLRGALKKKRTRRRARPSRSRVAPAERLMRLAASIAPHAPPASSPLRDQVTEAG